MPASTDELIAINSLLIEREAAFAQIHRIESRIHALLGDIYPLEAPEADLPSAHKQKPKKTKKLKKAKDPGIRIRRLQDQEVAYRVTWIDKGQRIAREVGDLRMIDPLIQNSLPSMQLIQIETVNLDAEAVEQLYPSP